MNWSHYASLIHKSSRPSRSIYRYHHRQRCCHQDKRYHNGTSCSRNSPTPISSQFIVRCLPRHCKRCDRPTRDRNKRTSMGTHRARDCFIEAWSLFFARDRNARRSRYARTEHGKLDPHSFSFSRVYKGATTDDGSG